MSGRYASYWNAFLFDFNVPCNYHPQMKFAKVMFLQVSVCPHRGGACMVLFGGCMVLFGGACVVLFGGHAWFYLGGACMVLFMGDVHGFIQGGMRGFFSFSDTMRYGQ